MRKFLSFDYSMAWAGGLDFACKIVVDSAEKEIFFSVDNLSSEIEIAVNEAVYEISHF